MYVILFIVYSLYDDGVAARSWSYNILHCLRLVRWCLYFALVDVCTSHCSGVCRRIWQSQQDWASVRDSFLLAQKCRHMFLLGFEWRESILGMIHSLNVGGHASVCHIWAIEHCSLKCHSTSPTLAFVLILLYTVYYYIMSVFRVVRCWHGYLCGARWELFAYDGSGYHLVWR